MKYTIDKEENILFDLREDFPDYSGEDYEDINLEYSMLEEYLASNPNKTLSDFGDSVVRAIKDALSERT